MRKVKLRGEVQSARGRESGVVEMHERDARPLVDSGAAEWADLKPEPKATKKGAAE